MEILKQEIASCASCHCHIELGSVKMRDAHGSGATPSQVAPAARSAAVLRAYAPVHVPDVPDDDVPCCWPPAPPGSCVELHQYQQYQQCCRAGIPAGAV